MIKHQETAKERPCTTWNQPWNQQHWSPSRASTNIHKHRKRRYWAKPSTS